MTYPLNLTLARNLTLASESPLQILLLRSGKKVAAGRMRCGAPTAIPRAEGVWYCCFSPLAPSCTRRQPVQSSAERCRKVQKSETNPGIGPYHDSTV